MTMYMKCDLCGNMIGDDSEGLAYDHKDADTRLLATRVLYSTNTKTGELTEKEVCWKKQDFGHTCTECTEKLEEIESMEDTRAFETDLPLDMFKESLPLDMFKESLPLDTVKESLPLDMFKESLPLDTVKESLPLDTAENAIKRRPVLEETTKGSSE